MTVLPESGPTSSSNSRKSWTPVLASLRVVSRPSTKAPMPAASTAAATGPVGRSTSSTWVVVTGSLIRRRSRDRRRLRDQGTEEAGDRRGGERAGEGNEHEQPRGAVSGEGRPVIEDQEDGERGQHRREPGDVLLPLHAELVPVLRLPGRVREQEVPRRALVAWNVRSLAPGPLLASEALSVPGIDDPRPRDHRQPGRNRHRRDAELQARQTLADPGRGDVLGTEAPEAGEPARKRQQEERAENQPVD